MSRRALSFGVMAEAYERFTPGYPVEIFDVVVAYAGKPVRTALEIGSPFLETDEVEPPDGTPPENAMQWPGTELQRSEWFADVQQSVIERRPTMSARECLGHLGMCRPAGPGT